MQLSDYQEKAKETALYPNAGKNIYYPAMGLAGEVGEVLNRVKKIMRDHDGEITDEIKVILKAELGDVLWYVSAVATELNLSLDDIAKANTEKLSSRKDRGVLTGSGDNR
ncbi:nucleoside triphosphate pyrophosphohydrolase family protein [Candidatus Uhrbacteria bacterium]|jgi:NTP pyrophosphatase (non-canonical NTP hydrolase)|nr:nucleoside triphosphate pyrophosphohydrolase family protein [Candidatus Uhrbacteria bacterium]